MEISAKRPSVRPTPRLAAIRQINMDRVYAFLMILPSIILLGIFVYGFIGQTFLWSLTDWEGLEADTEKHYIKLENYRMLFSDFGGYRFRQELVNTFFFTLFFLVGCLVLGFILAVLLDQNVKGEGIFRTIFLFPMALSFAVTGTIWRWLLNPIGGINVLPEIFGGKALDYSWLNNRQAYEFNWHEVPLTTLLLIIGVLLFVFFQLVWRRKYLSMIYLGLPMILLFLWMWSDWLTWDESGKLHGTFNWQDVPRYVASVIVIGFLLFEIYLLWHAKRRGALVFAIPAGLVLVWYATGGPDGFPNVPAPEFRGFNVALIGIILAAMWQLSGYTMAMYLAGIRGIPEELREAARVDGCNEWQVYTRIILPMLRPITLSAAIVLGHISLKVFDLIFAMVGTDYLPVSVPGVQVYTTMFRSNQFAVGSTIAIVLLVMVATVIVPYLVTSLRSEHEL
jgi:glucose/mannose transport system permease protein